MKKKFRCPVCGYVYEGENPPERCPQCGKTLFKARGGILKCEVEDCGFEKKVERKPRKKADAE